MVVKNIISIFQLIIFRKIRAIWTRKTKFELIHRKEKYPPKGGGVEK